MRMAHANDEEPRLFLARNGSRMPPRARIDPFLPSLPAHLPAMHVLAISLQPRDRRDSLRDFLAQRTPRAFRQSGIVIVERSLARVIRLERRRLFSPSEQRCHVILRSFDPSIISEGQVAASLPHARDRPVHARDDLTHDFITMPNDHVRITSHKTHTRAGKKRYGHDYLAAAAFPRASNRVADCIARRGIRDSCILVRSYLLVCPNPYHSYASV